ncbi:MAG: hypothetical protein ACI8P0_006620 [Planctomycetaceae bacterium]|jgi:hypothetical protein
MGNSMTNEHNDQTPKPDNLAIDGMLREYARTGGPAMMKR